MNKTVVLLVLLLQSTSLAWSQEPETVDRRYVSYAGPHSHGWSSASDSLFDAVASNQAVMDLFADLLRGRRTTDRPWKPEVALWWLAQNGSTRYLDVFVQWADSVRTDTPSRANRVALGLGVHASQPVARDRLLRLAESFPTHERAVVKALHWVNDPPAHDLLEALVEQGMSPQSRASAVGFLEPPPASSRPRRLGCSSREVFRSVRGQAYQCLDRPTRTLDEERHQP